MISRILFTVAPFAAAVFLTAQEPAHTPPLAAPSATATPSSNRSISVHEDVQYGLGGGQKLFLDIYEPSGPSATLRPGIVLIHGGGWSIVDKNGLSGMAQFLARYGFVAASMNYRLLHGADNRWPAQLDDVQRSVRWLRANAARYHVNPDRIGAFGHSAGAQLAALLGMEDTRDRDNSDPKLAKYSSRVNAVVDVSGPTDFTRGHDPDRDAFLANLLGATYSKQPEAWRDASPVFHVSPSAAPFLIVHGTRDVDVSIALSQELYEKLQQAGVPVTFIKVDDVHTFQTPEARHRLAVETPAFFNRYLVVARDGFARAPAAPVSQGTRGQSICSLVPLARVLTIETPDAHPD